MSVRGRKGENLGKISPIIFMCVAGISLFIYVNSGTNGLRCCCGRRFPQVCLSSLYPTEETTPTENGLCLQSADRYICVYQHNAVWKSQSPLKYTFEDFCEQIWGFSIACNKREWEWRAVCRGGLGQWRLSWGGGGEHNMGPMGSVERGDINAGDLHPWIRVILLIRCLKDL